MNEGVECGDERGGRREGREWGEEK
jgi:hypothetical protein